MSGRTDLPRAPVGNTRCNTSRRRGYHLLEFEKRDYVVAVSHHASAAAVDKPSPN
jgi:hypothetical protein